MYYVSSESQAKRNIIDRNLWTSVTRQAQQNSVYFPQKSYLTKPSSFILLIESGFVANIAE